MADNVRGGRDAPSIECYRDGSTCNSVRKCCDVKTPVSRTDYHPEYYLHWSKLTCLQNVCRTKSWSQKCYESDKDSCDDPQGQVLDCRRTVDNRCCVFPFIYDNVIYEGCTTVDNSGREWCALTNNYDSDELWANCKAQDDQHVDISQLTNRDKTSDVIEQWLSEEW